MFKGIIALFRVKSCVLVLSWNLDYQSPQTRGFDSALLMSSPQEALTLRLITCRCRPPLMTGSLMLCCVRNPEITPDRQQQNALATLNIIVQFVFLSDFQRAEPLLKHPDYPDFQTFPAFSCLTITIFPVVTCVLLLVPSTFWFCPSCSQSALTSLAYSQWTSGQS